MNAVGTNYAQTLQPANEGNRPLPPELQPIKGNMPINLGAAGTTSSINPASLPPPNGVVDGVMIQARPEFMTDFDHATRMESAPQQAKPPAPNLVIQKNIAIIEQRMHHIAQEARAADRVLVVAALSAAALALGVAVYLACKKSKPTVIRADPV